MAYGGLAMEREGANIRAAPRLVEDLIYDVGMHRGEDTTYYLAKGYRVVAFEANPELADGCRDEFSEAIESGALTIVEGAVAATTADVVPFYVDQVSVWGSIDPTWVKKKHVDRPQRRISVPVVDLAKCMRQYGVPHYLKIDIEGADRLCLEALRELSVRPRFVSMEAGRLDFGALLADIDLLERLGYRQFAAVQQADHVDQEVTTRTLTGESLTYRFPPGSSGPFGDDLTSGWSSRRRVVKAYRRAFRRHRLRDRLATSRIARRSLGPAYRRSPRFRRVLGGHFDTHARR
jgi:FkbM family methyltransferase